MRPFPYNSFLCIKYPLSALRWASFIPEKSHVHFGVPGTDSFSPFDPTHRHDDSIPTVDKRSFAYFRAALKELKPLPTSVPAILTYLALRAYERHASTQSALDLEFGAGSEDIRHLGFMIGLGTGDARQSFVAFPRDRDEQESRGRNQNKIRVFKVTPGGRNSGVERGSKSSQFGEDRRWDYEWARALPVDRSIADMYPARTFRPGSLEGVWEGVFSVCATPFFFTSVSLTYTFAIDPSTNSLISSTPSSPHMLPFSQVLHHQR